MVNLVKEKITAIVPAKNEEKTIAGVLNVLLDSKRFDEIIVVDGASKDRTAKISENMGVKVIQSPKRGGKGMAMKKGVESTNAEIVVFFDADLIGLRKDHIPQLVDPLIKNEVVMCTGERGRCWGLPYAMAKIDPLLAIGGERAIRRSLLENIPEKFIQNFAVETALNYYCLVNNLPAALVELRGVSVVPKEKKWGIIVGLSDRIREVWQAIIIRLVIIISKKDFKIKNV